MESQKETPADGDSPELIETPEALVVETFDPPPVSMSRQDARRRMLQLQAMPDRDRSDEEWDELNELEIQFAPGNRIVPENNNFFASDKPYRGGGANNPRPAGTHTQNKGTKFNKPPRERTERERAERSERGDRPERAPRTNHHGGQNPSSRHQQQQQNPNASSTPNPNPQATSTVANPGGVSVESAGANANDVQGGNANPAAAPYTKGPKRRSPRQVGPRTGRRNNSNSDANIQGNLPLVGDAATPVVVSIPAMRDDDGN